MHLANLSNRKGAAAVEAAVCLPVLVLIMAGSIEMASGVFHEYNSQACAYELSKVAMQSKSTCEDVQTLAASIMPALEFEEYSIKIEVIPRTENIDSVEPPTATLFDIPKTGTTPAGLDETPRGTLMRLTLTADRPPMLGSLSARFLDNEVSSDCVFVKEF